MGWRKREVGGLAIMAGGIARQEPGQQSEELSHEKKLVARLGGPLPGGKLPADRPLEPVPPMLAVGVRWMPPP